ncbi:SMI1/KNR4 family protein [Pantoea sp. Cy-639]|uniref:SMI1/KNR4 family protein n=1 Tax=Pantoea sp. Cy-639 TaxID=2608360 RepID=UPI0014202337|nr:SMI1/KNR4 family protein [Pantoea sp. Cy-639]NIF19822.1 SMI1/KNR4 family protein [Pantoea sp. Cy-639]
MSIQGLVRTLTPPPRPSESGVGITWPPLDSGMQFPRDFIEFITKYGTGRIADFILIFNPFSANEEVNFFRQKELILQDFRELIDSDSDYYSCKLYPETNGLVPVGVTDNGDYIFWVSNSKAESDEWTTAIIPARSPDVEYFDSDLTTLLERVLSKSIKCDSLLDEFPVAIRFDSF